MSQINHSSGKYKHIANMAEVWIKDMLLSQLFILQYYLYVLIKSLKEKKKDSNDSFLVSENLSSLTLLPPTHLYPKILNYFYCYLNNIHIFYSEESLLTAALVL